jgi:hypothetical protein
MREQTGAAFRRAPARPTKGGTMNTIDTSVASRSGGAGRMALGRRRLVLATAALLALAAREASARGGSSLSVTTTSAVSGTVVSGAVTIANSGSKTETVSAVTSWLEVRYASGVTPPAPPARIGQRLVRGGDGVPTRPRGHRRGQHAHHPVQHRHLPRRRRTVRQREGHAQRRHGQRRTDVRRALALVRPARQVSGMRQRHRRERRGVRRRRQHRRLLHRHVSVPGERQPVQRRQRLHPARPVSDGPLRRWRSGALRRVRPMSQRRHLQPCHRPLLEPHRAERHRLRRP